MPGFMFGPKNERHKYWPHVLSIIPNEMSTILLSPLNVPHELTKMN